MNVLLVVPRYSDTWGEFYQFPLGLGYITSAMKSAGHAVTVVNLNHIHGPVQEIMAKKISEVNPDVCATGSLSPFLDQIHEVFSASRRAKKDIINIAGGGVVSGEPGVILDAADIDIGVVSEGEETIQELLACIENKGDLKTVQGIVFRDASGMIVETPERPQIKDLSTISWPEYEELQVEENIKHQRALDCYFFHSHPTSQPRSVDMITSRSCPFKCTFCFHPTGKTYRERPLDDFFAELDSLIKRYDINMIGIIDELFSLKKSRLLEFCERMKPYNVQWMVQLHVRSATEEAIKALKDSGCAYISYGIESMSQSVLESMEKKSKVREIDDALALTFDNDIGIQGNLLFGDSSETLVTANESMHWWSKNRRYQIHLTPLMVFPGSPDYLSALKDGLVKESERLAFVKEIPVDINISKLNDKNLEMLRFQVWVFSESLLNVAPVTRFEVSDNQAEGRDTAFDIEWDCPRCDHQNDYLGVVLPTDAGYTMRLTCRHCNSRWDIQNKAYKPAVANAIDDDACASTLDKAEGLFQAGEYSQSHNIANELMRDAPNFIPARLFMAKFYRQHGPSEHMLKSYGAALGQDPLNPERHIDFADALREVGIYGASRMHYEQALSLDSGSEAASKGLEFIDEPQVSDEQRATYYISWSDEQPPKRKSSQQEHAYESVIKIEVDNNPAPTGIVLPRSKVRRILDKIKGFSPFS